MLFDSELSIYLCPKEKLLKLVILDVFLCIAINTFTENPRFNRVKKCIQCNIQQSSPCLVNEEQGH